ncbi:MAG: hypothetical protein ACKOA8_15050 [Deltaproteobacteria bacterium]
MNTSNRFLNFRFSPAIVLGLALISQLMGCLKMCPTSKERQTSVAATPWRLVETTDPELQEDLNNFSFLVFTFNQNFSGDIKAVVNNTQYDNPIRTFKYNIDPRGNLMRIQFAFAPGEDGGGAQSDSGAASGGDQVVEYSYKLGRSLELWRQDGVYYRLVPFTGILSPDETCSF